MTAPSLNLEGFTVRRHIGAGGLGDVFLAVRESTRGEVAIKLLREYELVEEVERRIGRELEALLMLKGHPGAIQIEEILQTRHGPAIVMEYASGGSLQSVIDQAGGLSLVETARVGGEIAALLADAHRLGIVHRDIKPQNILRTAFGTYKVCDFGIAALTKTPGWADRTSAISYRYASPEELDGAEVDGASDVFALGVTLVQARAGTTRGVRTPTSIGLPTATAPDREFLDLVVAMVDPQPTARPTAAEVHRRCVPLQTVSSPGDDDPFEATTVRRDDRQPRQASEPLPPPSTGLLPEPTTEENWWNDE